MLTFYWIIYLQQFSGNYFATMRLSKRNDQTYYSIHSCISVLNCSRIRVPWKSIGPRDIIWAVSKLPDKCLMEGERKKNKLDELETEEGRDRVIEKTL